MIRLLHDYNGHFYMIISLSLIGVAGFGQMSAQLSVEREAHGTLYTESGVSGAPLEKRLLLLIILSRRRSLAMGSPR